MRSKFAFALPLSVVVAAIAFLVFHKSHGHRGKDLVATQLQAIRLSKKSLPAANAIKAEVRNSNATSKIHSQSKLVPLHVVIVDDEKARSLGFTPSDIDYINECLIDLEKKRHTVEAEIAQMTRETPLSSIFDIPAYPKKGDELINAFIDGLYDGLSSDKVSVFLANYAYQLNDANEFFGSYPQHYEVKSFDDSGSLYKITFSQNREGRERETTTTNLFFNDFAKYYGALAPFFPKKISR